MVGDLNYLRRLRGAVEAAYPVATPIRAPPEPLKMQCRASVLHVRSCWGCLRLLESSPHGDRKYEWEIPRRYRRTEHDTIHSQRAVCFFHTILTLHPVSHPYSMEDPLSIPAGVVGMVSLGIQVCQSLYTYCTNVKERTRDV